MRVAIVENIADTSLGAVGQALDEAGAETTLFRPRQDGRLPAGPEAFDALVVLGGEQSAIDDADHRYLEPLSRLMRNFGEADRAILGICLGAQLLARGYGGTNLIGAAPEFGWCNIQVTDAGSSDPVLSSVGAAFPIFQWHHDTFTLPENAVHLAESAAAPHQAFRIGRAVYGTQFHFEANRAVVAGWTRDFPDAAEAMRPGWHWDHATEEASHGARADAAGLALARAWVSLI